MSDNISCSVLVMGGGIAGASAAIFSREDNVFLVKENFGASIFSSGCFDILPKEIDNFYHPYATVSDNRDKFPEIIKKFIEELGESNLSICGDIEREIILPTTLGTYKTTNFCLKSLYPGNILNMSGAHLLLVGISGLNLFYPELCAHSIKYFFSERIKSADYIWVDFPTVKKDNLNIFEIASLLEEEKVLDKFIFSLKEKIKNKSFNYIGFPQILGVEKNQEIINKIENCFQVPIFEVVPSVPSLSGLRIESAISRVLNRKNIKVIEGKITSAEKEEDIIKSVLVKTIDKEINIRAKKFILSTGKFLGGGIKQQPGFTETIFNLPLFFRDKMVNKVKPQELLSKNILSGQDIFSVGVRVNNRLQPLDKQGNVVYKNLYAVGSILGGFNLIDERCSSGVSIITGYLAACQDG